MLTKRDRYRNAEDRTLFDSLEYNPNSRSGAGRGLIRQQYISDEGEASMLVMHMQAHGYTETVDGKSYLRWYKLKRGVKSIISDEDGVRFFKPKRALKDMDSGDAHFISMCGRVCSYKDYEPTDELVDLRDYDTLGSTVKFEDIPTCFEFQTQSQSQMSVGDMMACRSQGLDTESMLYVRHSKYFKSGMYKDGRNLYDVHRPLVRNGLYRNENFYDEQIEGHYNPNSKYVYIHHAMNNELFFDEQEYLCSTENYVLCDAGEYERYKKIILFLL